MQSFLQTRVKLQLLLDILEALHCWLQVLYALFHLYQLLQHDFLRLFLSFGFGWLLYQHFLLHFVELSLHDLMNTSLFVNWDWNVGLADQLQTLLLIFWFLFRCFRDQDLADNLLLFCLLNFSGLQFFFFGLLSNNLVVLWKNGLRVLLRYNRLDDCLLHCLLDWLVLLFLRLIFGRLISTLTDRRLYGQPDRIRYMFRTWTSLNLRSQIPHADRRAHSHNLNLLLLRLEEQLLLHLLKFACHHLSRLFIYLILTTKNKSPIIGFNANPNKDITFIAYFK